MDNITFVQEGNVGIITMNRPKALNALDTKTLEEMDALLTQVETQEDVFVLVVTGAERAFVAGADISEMVDYNPAQAKTFSLKGNALFTRMEYFPKPIIAAVNGFALGGGCELAMACDIRVASEKAKFALPEVGLGIIPGFGGTQRLGRLIGTAKALELTLTTEMISGTTACELGLVNYVVAPEELMEKAMSLAKTIASKPQISVRQAKSAVKRGANMDILSGTSFEVEAFAHCFSTEDQKDAMAAHLNKTKIEQYKNR